MVHERAVIFANGEVTDPLAVRARLRSGDWLIAADGGLRHVQALGLAPHLLIGDMDSVDPAEREALEQQGAQLLVHPTDKNATDLELALLHAQAQGARDLLVVGAFGGRLDQTLANIALLALPELRECTTWLTDGRTDAVLVQATLRLHGRVGDRVSLLPLSQEARGVRTTGLRYALHGETLQAYRSRGISNEMIAPVAEVALDSGLLVCIHSRRQAIPSTLPVEGVSS
ncbi:MAG TPA: thiamine diphosphokinase [Anaerolineales bacterium]|nr:thiamine diphosphokinase [Anaerolineales bacterium]